MFFGSKTLRKFSLYIYEYVCVCIKHSVKALTNESSRNYLYGHNEKKKIFYATTKNVLIVKSKGTSFINKN